MATPCCPKCGSTRFETSVVEPSKSNFKLQFVHCSSCGCVVGTHEYYNIGALIHALAKALRVSL